MIFSNYYDNSTIGDNKKMKKYKLKALFRNEYDKLIPQDSVLEIMDEIVNKDYFEKLSKKIIKEETDFDIEDCKITIQYNAIEGDVYFFSYAVEKKTGTLICYLDFQEVEE